jgi:hypothetical protein
MALLLYLTIHDHIKSMSQDIHRQVKQQLKTNAEKIRVQLSESHDVSNSAQLHICIQYVHLNEIKDFSFVNL